MQITHANVGRKDAATLNDEVVKATGSDKDLDQHIAQALALPPGEFTGSIEDAKSVVEYLYPDGYIHVGYGVTGIFPCATLSTAGRLYASEAPTVPIAILRVGFAALAESVR